VPLSASALLLMCSVAGVVDLDTWAEAWNAGDRDALVEQFAPDLMSTVAAQLPHVGKPLELGPVRRRGVWQAAEYTLDGERGWIVAREGNDGRWDRWVVVPDGPNVDLGTVGQAADAATTAVGVWSSLAVELNPVVNAVGLPYALAVKLWLSPLAGLLPFPTCVTVKRALGASGAGATAWNIATLAGAPVGVGAGVGLLSAAVVGRSSAANAARSCVSDWEVGE